MIAAIAIAVSLLFAARMIVKWRACTNNTETETAPSPRPPVASPPPAEAMIYFLDAYRRRRSDAARYQPRVALSFLSSLPAKSVPVAVRR